MIDLDNTLMFKTLFKLLDHDTRNTFVKLNALVSDLDESPVKDMITDSVQELYDIIASSSGFIDGKKRIMSMYDIISQLSLTSDKIALSHHHRVKLTTDPKIYLFVEVSELFNHAILNIIENALKYSPTDTVVEVDIKREENYVTVYVKDSGIGIDKGELEAIFNQGYRASNAKSFEGTGTGLWITKNIIQRDSGTIEVYQNDDKGTIFKVMVPIFFTNSLEESMDIVIFNYVEDNDELDKSLSSVKTLIDMHNPPPQYHYDSLVFANLLNYLRKEKRNKTESHFKEKLLEIKSKNPNGKTVLIVDDSTYVHYYLGSFFSKLGYRVLDFAYNGQEGFNLYETYNPDIVTLDITMPVMSGLEASEKILEFDPKAKLLFLSGLGGHGGLHATINNKLKGRPYGILTKPFKLEDLKDALTTFNQL
ncbi:response regulator [Thiospirochaeta perfilievii]|uniref:histidine kinase n=1 Tax=Thiospirochaeta perfilievii TaxID=252967 RepID=A0A5C1QGL1_9SPIO|nr:ATP-binding protein [Thiospirochaeta perfilievii]QEN05706.1 response regulator [Thiospirochaeta perfilievii]